MVGANLNETKLNGADLQYADLSGARLQKADLSGADLRDAILTDANLSNAILNETDLTTTNLVGANLTGTRVWRAHMFAATGVSPTQYDANPSQIESIADLFSAAQRLRQHHITEDKSIELYFRGEPEWGWPLKPSVMREDYVASESQMLSDLMSRRPEDFSTMGSSLAQWVLGQHHGLKTRFLDVTKNPMVGLFYACEQSDVYDVADGCLHMFGVPRSLVKSFNSDSISVISNFAKLSRGEQNLLLGKKSSSQRDMGRRSDYYGEAVNRLIQLAQQEKPNFQKRIDIRDLFRVFVVEPQQLSERLRVQSGAFLVSAFHERFERSEIECRVTGVPVYAHYVLSIPADCKASILEGLRLINIRRESLYPGLDESAKAITYYYGGEKSVNSG